MKSLIRLVLLLGVTSLSFGQNDYTKTIENTQKAKIDTFTFSSDGTEINGKIYLPASFSKDKSPHSIYLIDFTEQHFKEATDEFEKVISATREIQDFDAVVVTLEERLDVSVGASNRDFQKYYNIFKDMASYVDTNYTNNNSRTIIGRGSEAGLVLMTLFLEDSLNSVFDNFIATDSPSSFNNYIITILSGDNLPKNKQNKKLHFSFSKSNNRKSCLNLILTIDQAKYPWLQFESLEYVESNYENTYPEAFAEGLKYMFNDVPSRLEENSSTSPIEYQLEQNYPNPFNPTTTIQYTVPNFASDFISSSKVSLIVFDVLGREVKTLVNEQQTNGSYKVNFNASGLESGVYFYRLNVGSYTQSRKMILLK